MKCPTEKSKFTLIIRYEPDEIPDDGELDDLIEMASQLGTPEVAKLETFSPRVKDFLKNGSN